jgi:hypothetical protein
MRADLEIELMQRVRGGELARVAIRDMCSRGDINAPKQAARTLEKWCRKGWYDYGVALDLGWLTAAAPGGGDERGGE